MEGCFGQQLVHRLAGRGIINKTGHEVCHRLARGMTGACRHQRCNTGLRQCLKPPLARADSGQPGRPPAPCIKDTPARGITKYRLRCRNDIATRRQYRQMRHGPGQIAHEIIGNAYRFGPVHDRQLVIIQPGDIQQDIGPDTREGGAGYRTIIADSRIMNDITIMQDGRGDRHQRIRPEFAQQLNRRPV